MREYSSNHTSPSPEGQQLKGIKMARVTKKEKEQAREYLKKVYEENITKYGYKEHDPERQIMSLSGFLSGYLPNITFEEGWEMIKEVVFK